MVWIGAQIDQNTRKLGIRKKQYINIYFSITRHEVKACPRFLKMFVNLVNSIMLNNYLLGLFYGCHCDCFPDLLDLS